MTNYNNTIIYKIICNNSDIDNTYIGHTVNFRLRKNHHKMSCEGKGNNKNCNLYKFINNNGGWVNFKMIEIEKYPCLNKNEACERERYHYDLYINILNDRSPHKRLINNSERCKKWRNQEKFKCNCGKEITICNKSRHFKICKYIE